MLNKQAYVSDARTVKSKTLSMLTLGDARDPNILSYLSPLPEISEISNTSQY